MISLCSLIPTRCSNSMARRFFQLNKRCHQRPLNVHPGILWMSCLPIFWLGSRQVNGSWNTIEISLPTSLRRCAGVSFSNSTSLKRKRSAVTIQESLKALQITLAMRLLPEPDSPTKPQISPSSIVKLTLSTMRINPFGVWISMRRLRISRRAIVIYS